MLKPEQVGSIKSQLIQQIEKVFPEDKKQFAISQIEEMDADELEKFLINNKLVQTQGGDSPNSCVFCSIVFGDIQSFKISETSKAVAVLEINPLTEGHTIVIPKEHVSSEEEIPKEVKSFSKRISTLLKKKLEAKQIKSESGNIFGHQVINLIPIHEDQKPSSERKPAEPEELQRLQEKLKRKLPSTRKRAPTRKKKGPIKKIVKEFEKIEKTWLPKRIP
jgi:diadenosine tetraphosphate (Ap4A) HIT family hydrolase